MCAAQVGLATVDDKVASFGLELAQAEDDLAALGNALARQTHRQPLQVRGELVPQLRPWPELNVEGRFLNHIVGLRGLYFAPFGDADQLDGRAHAAGRDCPVERLRVRIA